MLKADSDPERKDTRSQIVTRAAELFAQWGYAGASISDIAAAVGVSKPALYHHFPDKEQIYTEIVASVLSGMLENAKSAISNVDEPIEKLRQFMLAHADYFEQNQDAYVASQLGFRGLRAPLARDRAVGYRDAYESLLRDILREADEAGVLKIDDVAITGRLILSSLNWMTRWYRADGKLRARHFADQYANIILNGLFPRESHTPRQRRPA